MQMSQNEVVAAVRSYARSTPEKGNWSLINTWSDAQIKKVIGRCGTVDGALRFVGRALNAQTAPGQVAVLTPGFSVVDKFTMLEEIAEMVITGRNKAMLVCGGGGTGKTFTLLNVLQRLGLTEVAISAEEVDAEDTEEELVLGEENTSYLKVTGSVSPMGLYKLLFNHKDGGKLIFDDCDAVFSNQNSVDMLKGVLDTSGNGQISWHSPAITRAGLPTSFVFNGKIIFITNKKLVSLPQPILSRGLIINMDLTKREIVDRARMLGESLLPNLTEEQREELFLFVEENISSIGNVTLRLFTLAAPFLEAGKKNWKKLLLFTNPA